jgi:hypothetical protein
MSKVFLIDVAIQWGMLKKHCVRNIGPLYHAFTLNCYNLAIHEVALIEIFSTNYCHRKVHDLTIGSRKV